MRTRVESSFRRSLTLCVCLASVILAAAEGTWFPVGLTPVIAAFAFFVGGRWPWTTATATVGNVLGAIAFIVAALEFYNGAIYEKLLAGAHMLVYLTWIVLLMKKGFRQYWWLCALSVLQLAVASVITQDAMFGASLIGMLFVLVWTMSVFTLHRAQSQIGSQPDSLADSLKTDVTHDAEEIVSVENGLQSDATEPWLGWGFRCLVTWTAFGSLIVGGIAFALFPRYFVPGMGLEPPARDRSSLNPRTGFNEEIQLGNVGTIQPSEERVMQLSITQQSTQQTVTIEHFAAALSLDEVRFRGTVLTQYQNGRWTQASGFDEERKENASRNIRQLPDGIDSYAVRITQDPPLGQYAFGIVPMRKAVNIEGPGDIRMGSRSESLYHPDRRRWPSNRTVTYEIHCPVLPDDEVRPGQAFSIQDFIDMFNPVSRRSQITFWKTQRARQDSITPDLNSTLPGLAELTKQVCSQPGLQRPPHQPAADQDQQIDESRETDLRRIEAIQRYLSSSDNFTYSLNQQVQDRSIDPVEDFLLNHRTGHCEYFASACALMLQSVDIPARVVNGYKGSELNTLTGQYEVRQKHAHAWVEAWATDHWVTVDPTPAAARAEVVQATSSFGLLTDLRGAFTDGWFALVQKMSLSRQRELVQPLIDLFNEVKDNIEERGIWEATKLFVTQYVMSPQKWFSWQGGAVTFVLLWTIGMIIRRRPWLTIMKWLRRLRRRFDSRHRAARSVIRFYETFRTTCKRHGLRFTDNQTANENACLAVEFFNNQLQTEELKAIPHRIADAFNRVRFGSVTLTPSQATEVRSDLQRFSSLIGRTNTSAPDNPSSPT